MWLADIKQEYRGVIFVQEARSHLAITHCCCDYPPMSKAAVEEQRRIWESIRNDYRDEWSKQFGDWPHDGQEYWPGHHVFDLKRGGDPIGWVIPFPKDVHAGLKGVYSRCYRGSDGWNQAGPEWPYSED